MSQLGAALATEGRAELERWFEQRSRAVYVGADTVLCRVLGNIPFYVDGRDQSLAHHLMLSGYWEMWITQCVARNVKPGMRCIDVGANVGYYTALLCELVGEQGQVQAWEPLPRLVELLEKTLRASDWGRRAEIVSSAAGSAAARANLLVPCGAWGSSNLGGRTMQQTGNETVSVPVERVDALPFAASPVDFVKVDAEGHEPAVWEGLSGVLEASPDVRILLEWSPEYYEDPSGFLDRIEAAGFRLQLVGTDGDPHPVERPALLGGPMVEMMWLIR